LQSFQIQPTTGSSGPKGMIQESDFIAAMVKSTSFVCNPSEEDTFQ
jgi:hypothetical protein